MTIVGYAHSTDRSEPTTVGPDESSCRRPTMTERPVRRRRLLKTLGASAVVGSVAGCSSDGETMPEESEPTATPPPSATPTQTPRETPESGGRDEQQDQQAPSGPTVGTGECALGTFPDSATAIGGDVTSDRTLGGSGRTTYRVTETLSVYDGATLTIEPGTKLEFAGGTSLKVWANSTLSAVGTCGDPILMTGDQELPGTWNGVQFTDSNRVDNRLSHCRIEYGGDSYQGANLILWDNSRLAVDNCTLTDAETKNFSFNDATTVTDFSNTVVTNAGEYAGQCQPYMAQGLSDSSTYAGNGKDYVKVWASSLDTDYEGTWDAIDVPYRLVATSVSEELSISGDLTLAKGTDVEVEQDLGITVYRGGSLRAIGDLNEQGGAVGFFGTTEEAQFWRGIAFEETERSRNELSHVQLFGAGAFPARFADEPAAVSLVRGANATLDQVLVFSTGDYGLYLDSGATGTITASDFGSLSGGVYAHADAAHLVGPSNNYGGTDDVAVVVRAGTITDDVSWEQTKVPYRIVPNSTSDAVTVSDQGSLDFAPGVTVEFTQDTALWANDSAALTAVGEADNPITFTGTQQQAGHWGGIFYVGTGNQDNTLENCTIEYGGAYNAPFSNDPANVAVMRQGGSATIQNCTIRYSGGAGMVREETATWTTANNTFENNVGQNTVVDPEP